MDGNGVAAVKTESSRTDEAPKGPIVVVNVDGGLATITINRPDKLNALSLQTAKEFSGAVAGLAERTDVGVVLIMGAGGQFCAGGDVAEMAAADDRGEFLNSLVAEMHAGLSQLAELPLVTITAVQGTVAGGGIGLMLAGDWIIADERTRFTSAYAGIGLSPDCGMTSMLPRAVGLRRSLEFTLSGRLLNASDALSWGLITEVVGSGELAARAEAVAHKILAGPVQAMGETRRLFRTNTGRNFREGLQDEQNTISKLARTETAGARIADFAAPRQPTQK